VRIIKFRAWDRRHQKMLENAVRVGEILYWDGGKCFTFITDFNTDPPRHEVMQFTELLDKNGVEICEGDVVKGSHPVMSRPGHIDGSVRFIGVVGYDSRWGGFRRQGVNQYKGLSAALMHGEELEVIGNIHQHPELLNP